MTAANRRTASEIARRLADAERRLRAISRSPQLASSSIEGGAIHEYTDDGTLASIIGAQHDGTHTTTSVTGPIPPRPAQARVNASPGVVEYGWNGKFDFTDVSPMDFRHVAGYVVPTGEEIDLTAQAGVLTGELGDAKQVHVPAAGLYDVYLVSWSLSGKHSSPSEPVTVTVPELVDMSTVESRLEEAEAEIAAALEDFEASGADLGGRLTAAEGELAEAGAAIAGLEGDVVVAAKTAAVEDLYVLGTGTMAEAVIDRLFADVVRARTVTADAFIGENAILTGAITAPKITASEELTAKVASFLTIYADQIDGNAINGMTITGSLLQSSPDAERGVKFGDTGISAYTPDGRRTFNMSAATGNVEITGSLYSGEAGVSSVMIDDALWQSYTVRTVDGVDVPATGAGVRLGLDDESGVDLYYGEINDPESESIIPAGVVRGPKMGGRRGELNMSGRGDAWIGSTNNGENQATIYAYGNGGAEVRSNNSAGAARATYSAYPNGYTQTMSYDTEGNERASVQTHADGTVAIASLATDGTVDAGLSTDGGGTYIHGNLMLPHGFVRLAPAAKYGTAFIQSDGPFEFTRYASTARQQVAMHSLITDEFVRTDQVVSSGQLNLFGYNGGTDLQLKSGGGIVSTAVYNRTYTSSANMYITGYGTIGRSTSSRRNKLCVEELPEIDDALLSLKARTWFDREESESVAELYTLEDTGEPILDEKGVPIVDTPDELRRIPGMVAEEVEEAGLTQFVQYGEDGQVEGLMYDRLGVALIPVVARLRDRVVALEAALPQLTTKG